MCYLYRRDLYRHIRGKHYRDFPQLKYHGRNVVFTTDTGIPVNFGGRLLLLKNCMC